MKLNRACDACIKSKRRCSREKPECSRCQTKRVSCHYENEPLIGTADTIATAFNHESDDSERPDHHWSVDSVARRPWTTTERGGSHHSYSTTAFSGPSLTIIRVPEPVLKFEPDAETVCFLVDTLRSHARQFLASGSTAFIHAGLSRIAPDSTHAAIMTIRNIHDALRGYHHQPVSASATITTDTTTAHFESSSIEQTISLYLDLGPRLASFSSLLVFVQCLTMIQIMTLFFFSPATQPQQQLQQQQIEEAERRNNILVDYTCKLWSEAPDIIFSTMSRQQAYILAKSTRRTLHVSHQVRAAYSCIRYGHTVHSLFVESLPVARDGRLWYHGTSGGSMGHEGVRSSSSSRRAATTTTKQKNLESDLVSYRELVDLWYAGRLDGGQVDGFLASLIVACNGKRAAEERMGKEWVRAAFDGL